MSLGDNRSNNKLYENTYYSRLKFKDYKNKLALGFKFKSGMLVVDVSKEKDGFQYESIVDIYITTTKAKILLNEMHQFEKDIDNGTIKPEKGYGINTGMGEIVSILAFHVTESGGKAVFVAKVDNAGNFTRQIDFNFNCDNFHYGLQWNNIPAMDVNKNYYNDLEFDQFKDVLKQFINNSSGAFGYSVADITRYDHQAIMNKMNPIYDKLGIERYNNSSGGFRPADNFMNSPKNTNSNHKSYDDIDDELPFLD